MEKKILNIIENQNEILKKMLDKYEIKNEYKIKKKSDNHKIQVPKDLSNPEYKLFKISKNKNKSQQKIKKSIKTNPINLHLLNSVKNKPILIFSTQYPGYGGGATNSYNIHKFLKCVGFTNVVCVFFVHEKFYTQENFNFNPENLDKTLCFNRLNINELEVKKTIFKTLGVLDESEILLAFAKNIWSNTYISKILPSIPLIYLVSGSAHITTYVSKHNSICFDDIKAQPDLLKKLLNNNNEEEVGVFKKTKYVCCNSENSYDIMTRMYPDFTNINKLFTTYLTVLVTSYMNNIEYLVRSDKVFDVAYIVSNFERNIKGSYISSKIFKKIEEVCKSTNRKLNVCIIGNNYNILNLQSTKEVTYNMYLCKPNDEAIQYIYNSKVLIIPSLYEACPNTMHEGIILGANIVTSKNVGSYEILLDENIVDDYHNVEEWSTKIFNQIDKPDHIPDISYCDSVITDILKIIYECNINKIKTVDDISYKNRLYLDYDFLKMFGIEVVKELIKMGFKIMLPDYIFTIFKNDLDDKYKQQLIKLIEAISPFLRDHNDSFEKITRSEYINFIKDNGNTAVFSNFKNVDKYFVNSKIVTKVSQLNSVTEKNLVINLYHPNNQIPDICEFIRNLNFESLFIISSLTKII
jgi:hypothetical protein